MKPKVIVIVGPTAVGKTKLSVELAKTFNCEIVSGDSMQVYKYMDIGTAKPTLEERQGIRHYLVDEVEPNEEFNVVQYKALAEKYIEKIIKTGKTPLIVGGTGLYINSILQNINFSQVAEDKEYREELKLISETNGNEYLYDMLKKVDPLGALKLHSNDVKRVIRALEVYKCTNTSIASHNEKSKLEESKYDFIVIGLYLERDILYQRINQRVDQMISQGLIKEVKELLIMGMSKGMTSMQAIGYKEIVKYLEGEISLEDCIEIIKRESRRYAKRQYTWFNRNKRIKWFDLSNQDFQNILKIIQEYIAQEMVIM